jgi:hypothetical protein
MRGSGGLLFLTLAGMVSAVPAIGAERVASVPARFQGTWAASAKACAAARNDSRLAIAPERIRYAESEGAIRAVVTQGERELALIAELSGEGETWLALSHFRLSADDKSLSDISAEPAFVRVRCR